MLTLVPGKPGERVDAWTVDDAIRYLCTITVFKLDVNLAIDVFRELKEREIEDCYGQRFSHKKFIEFVSQHPNIKGRMRYDKTFRGKWFLSKKSNYYIVMRKEAFESAYKEAVKKTRFHYDTELKIWLSEKKKPISWEEYASSPENIQEVLAEGFKHFQVEWPFETKITRKFAAKNGEPISKGQFRKAFEYKFDNVEGLYHIPSARNLKCTPKVQVNREVVLDNASSYEKFTGDYVEYEVEWVVVKTPWHGEDEFYLGRIFRLGKSKINPAYAHLLFTAPRNKGQRIENLNTPEVLKARKAWDSAGSQRCGWRPNAVLSPIYGVEVVKAEEANLTPELHDGNWVHVDGLWQPEVKEPRKYDKNSKSHVIPPHQGTRGKFVRPEKWSEEPEES
jgi:hypothetical protein